MSVSSGSGGPRRRSRLTLSENYRSRPEVLAAVNHVFGEEFGDGYQPLAASGEFPDPVFGHPVELLVTDKEAYKDSGVHWRRAEAKHVARRVRELVDAGAATPGEIVLLFAAGTDAEWYEEELRALGLPTYRATGRRYFGQQQVVDLLMYLRLLRNRYDDEALAAVLASPFIGVSNDALVLIRRHAGRRPLFTGIERSLPEPLSAEDERLVRAFKQRYERLVAASARVSLERLCELVVSEHDYDLAVLARWDGARRYANLRKLMRLARGYEEVRGRDLEGFLVFLRSQEALGAAQLEAVSEEEGSGAVRLLTIHAAKGLEFKVVVVADAGRDLGGPPPSDEILALADGRFGFKIVHPISGDRKPVFDYDEVADAGREAARAERLRLYYVAMTRAIDRLLVSGAVGEGRDTPIGWVLSKLDCEAELAAGDGVFELERGGASFLVRVDRPAEEAPVEAVSTEPAPVEAGEAQLSLFTELPSTPPIRGWLLPELVPVPAPPLHRVTQLSYSALALFGRCSYRYYAERVARLPERRGEGPSGGGMTATEIGDAVHRVLETVDLAAPQLPSLDPVRDWYPEVTDDELERIGALTEAFCDSELAGRIAALDGPRAEVPFAFEHDGVLMRGRLDVLHRADGTGVRSRLQDERARRPHSRGGDRGRLPPAAARVRARSAPRRRRGGRGRLPVPRMPGRGRQPGRSPALTCRRSKPSSRTRSPRINAGRFVPSPGEFTCSGCPALDLVCAGPRLRGGDPGGRESVVASYEAWMTAIGFELAEGVPGALVAVTVSSRVAPTATRSFRGRGGCGSVAGVARSYLQEARRKVGPKRERIRPVIDRLAIEHADARIALNFKTPLELLVSVMLSAQTTDVSVNKVTERLFLKYRRPEDYLAVPVEELEQDIFQTGFYRQKAKALRGTMAILIAEHGGEVPESFDDLLRLPGVARKTANVVSAERGHAQGIVVDTHVRRLSQRLGFTRQEDPVQIERDLMKLVPRPDWARFPHLLIWHGRRVCDARRPDCEGCVLSDLCPSSRV